MSKLIVSGHSSGTGSFIIRSPALNNDRELTIPDLDGELVAADSSGNITVSGTVTANGDTLSDDQTASEIKTAYESNSDTNEFSDTEQTKLSNIEENATADQTAAQIKTAYESNAVTNAFTDDNVSKLSGIEASADVTDAVNVTNAGAVMDSELASIADIKALDQSVVSGASPVLTVANMTLDDTDLIVASETNLQNFIDGVDHALLKARGTGVDTSYIATVAIGGTTFAVPAINGEINSDEGYFHVEYAGATGITVATLGADSTYVYIDKNSALQQQTTIPTRQDLTRKVFVMRIAVDTSSSTIINFEYLNNPIGHYANSIRDVYSYLLAAGVPFVKDMTVTGRTDNLGFDIAAGSLLEFGGTGDIYNPNIKSFDAVANAEYFLLTRTNIDAGGNTDLVKTWDNNGTLTALGSTTCVAHRVYRISSGAVGIQYGQGNYANMVLCKAGARLEEYIRNPILANANFLGWWLIEETATATSGTVDAEFVEYTIGIQGGSSSSLSGALLRGNNLSDVLDATTSIANLGLDTLLNAKVNIASGERLINAGEITKLSNIESNATADQTKSEIDALNIDAGTLDSINSTSFLRSDSNDTGSGNYEFTGSAGLDLRSGLHGGYSSTSGTGGDWGANIWGIGDSYNGTNYGINYAVGNHYGVSWLREVHPDATALIGEGIYIHQGGVSYGGFGHLGAEFPGGIVTAGTVTANPTETLIIRNSSGGVLKTIHGITST